MTIIHFDSPANDMERRAGLFDGQLFVYSPRPSTLALCAFARELLAETFAPLAPAEAQAGLSPAEFAARVARCAPQFNLAARTRQLVQAILVDFGCDPARTYFTPPHLRASTHGDYHEAFPPDAYLPYRPPHRDTWYSGIHCGVNWWVPIYDLALGNGLAIYPRYWRQAVHDGRAAVEGALAADRAPHSSPLPAGELAEQVQPVCPAGGVLVFASAQLHATVPNCSGRVRFSFDFRTVCLDDVEAVRGAPNLDGACRATQLRRYRRGADLAAFPGDAATRYERQTGATDPGAVGFDELLALVRLQPAGQQPAGRAPR